jgi:hypothetical protein
MGYQGSYQSWYQSREGVQMGFLVMSMNEVVQAAWDAKLISGYNVEYVNIDALMRFAEEVSRVAVENYQERVSDVGNG